MPPFKQVNQTDDEDQKPKEIVGSKDLRETFKDKDRVRGGFAINGVEFHNFEANSPASVVSGINGKTGSSGVTASIDDQGHLVLENNSNRDIRISLGKSFDEAPKPASGDVATDVLNKLKDAGEKMQKGDEENKNTILDDLGLEATEEAGGEVAARPGFETGASAEDRQKAREDAQNGDANRAGVGDRADDSRPMTSGQTKDPTQVPSAPITGGAEQGKLDDGRGRTGTGAGHMQQPDGTRPAPGTSEQHPEGQRS